MTDLGMHALGAARARGTFRKLRYLEVSNNFVTAAGVQSFVAHTWPQLDTLLLGHNSLGTPGALEVVVAVYNRGRFPSLRMLDLAGNGSGVRIDLAGIDTRW